MHPSEDYEKYSTCVVGEQQVTLYAAATRRPLV